MRIDREPVGQRSTARRSERRLPQAGHTSPQLMAADSKLWKEDGLDGWAKGSRVWYRAGPDDWRAGTLQAPLGSAANGAGPSRASWRVALEEPLGPGAGSAVDAPPGTLVPANPALLEGAADLTHLSFLNEPSVLHALRRRYGADAIYTHAGPVLVAVNPFRPLPGLYSRERAAHYKARPHLEAADGYEPHVFLTADKAYKQVGAKDAAPVARHCAAEGRAWPCPQPGLADGSPPPGRRRCWRTGGRRAC